MKHSKKIREILKECFWYNGDKKENMSTDFFRYSKIRITDEEDYVKKIRREKEKK